MLSEEEITKKDVLRQAIRKRWYSIVEALIKDGVSITNSDLRYPAIRGDKKMVEILIGGGANPRKLNRDTFEVVEKRGHNEILSILRR